jgi:hypothetical protein
MNPDVIVRIFLANAPPADRVAQETTHPRDARQANKGRTDAPKRRSVDDDARRVSPAMRVPSPLPNREFRGGQAHFARITIFGPWDSIVPLPAPELIAATEVL